MSPLARSLLALAAAAAAAAALLQGACALPPKLGDSQCTSVMHGHDTPNRKDLHVVYVPSGVKDASVDIPNACYPDIPVGELVTVCDDVPPTVIVPDLPEYSPATVHRHGDYTIQAAPVSVIMWCPRNLF